MYAAKTLMFLVLSLPILAAESFVPRLFTIPDSVTFTMLEVPASVFVMGNNQGEAFEGPEHPVSLASYYLGETAVTWDMYQPCVDAGACLDRADGGWGRGTRPVISVSWRDAQNYVNWLRNETGLPFRLPSEAEWEFAARAGIQDPMQFTDFYASNRANCNIKCGDDFLNTSPSKTFSANAYGFYDLLGNTWEWVEDCFYPSYEGAAADGRARTEPNCKHHVLRGGSWTNTPNFLLPTVRSWNGTAARRYYYGFRIALSTVEY